MHCFLPFAEGSNFKPFKVEFKTADEMYELIMRCVDENKGGFIGNTHYIMRSRFN